MNAPQDDTSAPVAPSGGKGRAGKSRLLSGLSPTVERILVPISTAIIAAAAIIIAARWNSDIGFQLGGQAVRAELVPTIAALGTRRAEAVPTIEALGTGAVIAHDSGVHEGGQAVRAELVPTIAALGTRIAVTTTESPRPLVFGKNHSSRLYFAQDGGRVYLEVCADNLPGETVFARIDGRGKTSETLSQRASGRCVTFRDMDAEGSAPFGTNYTTRAALNQPPNKDWPVPCYDATGGQGLCDGAQYPFAADAVSIESMPVKVIYYFSGVGDPKNGNTGDGLSVFYDENSHANYRLNYVLPDEGNGWVGLAFLFSKKQDLADRNFIEVKMTFDTAETYCLLFIKDNTDTLEDSVPLKLGIPLREDIKVDLSGREQTLTIPLDTYFEHVNRKAITEVDVDCDTKTTRGNRTFTVNSIRFLRS